ncbi:MAG: hypothetical protein ACQRW7_13525 [Caulobacterales bacterium]|uniref:hypothetical protein n=1 Tax=Glycocaulis sp. TaxID=1969725 RepID=UPI003FA09441
MMGNNAEASDQHCFYRRTQVKAQHVAAQQSRTDKERLVNAGGGDEISEEK